MSVCCGGASRWLVTALLGVLVAGLVSSCTPDYERAVPELVRRLEAVPGVAKVETYVEPGDELMPGSVGFQVQMSPDAEPGEVVEVLGVGYDGLREDFGRDSGDLSVDLRHHHLELHVRHPEAEPAEIARVAAYALSLAQPGEHVQADLNARDEEDFGPLETQVVLHLAKGSTRSDVLPRLDELADPPARTGVGVRSPDGAGIVGDAALPSDQDVAAWRELLSSAWPGSFEVFLSPINIAPDEGYRHADVTTRTGVPAGRAREQALETLVRSHFVLLEARVSRFHYNLTVNGQDAFWFSSTHCDDENTSGWRTEVNRWYFGGRNCPDEPA